MDDWGLSQVSVKGMPEPIETTGHIAVTIDHNHRGDVTRYMAEWVGGDVVAVSYELIDYLDLKVYDCIYEAFLFGFTMQVLLHCPELGKVYFQRVYSD